MDDRHPHARLRKRLAVAATTTAAAAVLAGCGGQRLAANLERIKQQSNGPVYWLGSSFAGLPLTDAEAWVASHSVV